MTGKVSKDEVVGFRLNAHHLTDRLGEKSLSTAAGSCAIQNSPPGSALLALHARVENVTRGRMDEAVVRDKSLLQTWCMRGSPFYFPTADAAVFTIGVLPPTEDARRHFILGVAQTLDALDMSLTQAVELTETEIRDVLSGRQLAINELGTELSRRIVRKLPAKQAEIWEGKGPYAPDQPLGEGVVHFCIRILAVQGTVCIAARVGNTAPFVLVDEWLDHPLPDMSPDVARAELLRRYLRCYGPSSRKDFAAWIGVFPGDVDPWWDLVSGEMTEVEFGGRRWLLTEDLEALRSSPKPRGVRLLPPRDPYTQTRDRETILAKKYHKEVWKLVGEPGTVLFDGEIVGVWRPRKTGPKLAVQIKALTPLTGRKRTLIRDEAAQVAMLRGASSAEVEFHEVGSS